MYGPSNYFEKNILCLFRLKFDSVLYHTNPCFELLLHTKQRKNTHHALDWQCNNTLSAIEAQNNSLACCKMSKIYFLHFEYHSPF
ncbi:hypothetical protein BpHYR1_017312 [Brachionus plicatilis]|uniref:Uncharacterized protein n=1 Tax=Brachionus plicatilis TaxID=10195 RepID=A0A3M7R4P8_BRAPC|nr:hypothetical protein BpHYR1_017312 [Brachionus plicatilis]